MLEVEYAQAVTKNVIEKKKSEQIGASMRQSQ